MPIYMQYEGIDGDVTAKGHEKWIELESFAWGDERNIASQPGRSTNREASAPKIKAVEISKSFDDASLRLAQESLDGEGKKVTIEFLRTSAGALETFLKYVFDACIISRYDVTSGTDKPTERLLLSFTKIEMSFTPALASNKAKGANRFTYDVSTAKMA